MRGSTWSVSPRCVFQEEKKTFGINYLKIVNLEIEGFG
jgi:hypothetical protein